jgi:Methyltransferase domain
LAKNAELLCARIRENAFATADLPIEIGQRKDGRRAWMKKRTNSLVSAVDVLLVPFVYPAAWLLKLLRRAGIKRLPLCKQALMNVGVFPVRNHYYEPQFDNRYPKIDFAEDRSLPGINWNARGQLETLKTLTFSNELADLPKDSQAPLKFHLDNGFFLSGDAEFWYQIIRARKPKRIYEIGSGYSTLMAIAAIDKNKQDDPAYACEHVCIEPYEMPWLEQTGITVIRKPIEDLELSFFSRLQENDILFIDSSHIIRPQGDIVFEYLQLLPSLNKGVIVHIHDIFSPKNYLKQWLQDDVLFWNEQYLLEAFLTHNESWLILAALNFLHHHHYEKLQSVAPFLTPDREPGSFYIQKVA